VKPASRAGDAVELKPRPARIDTFRLLECPDSDHATFQVESGKGVYMRALARDMALKLGTFGHISAIRRLAVGPYRLAAAISLEKLEALGHSAPPADRLLPVRTALDDIPALALTEAEAGRLHQGQAVAVLPVAKRSNLSAVEAKAVYFTACGDRPVALVHIEGGEIRPFRVFNL